MDGVLNIKNLDKIVGQHLYSKWIPKTTGWVVSGVESVGDTYIFLLACSKDGIKQASVQLNRMPSKYEPYKREYLYELWEWNHQTNKPEQMWCMKTEMNSISDMALRLGMIIEKIT